MKVSINTAGHCVEIESGEAAMNVHRLANIAVNTWRRTVLPDGESCGPAVGFTSQVSTLGRGYRHFRYGSTPLDAS
jgi:hypothetical protein